MLRRLLFLSFIEGAAVMAAEPGGARLLAPVFGSSLYTWATVMGVTLGALAGGYFFGGWISAGTARAGRNLRLTLLAASIFILLMPVIAFYLVPRISYFPFTPGVILSTVILLLPAIFLLGASSPLFIQLQAARPDDSGRVSGTIYAVSTAGGIISTFACGFFLIPELGLDATLYLFGIFLFICTIIVLGFKGFFPFLLLGSISYLNYQIFRMQADTIDGVMGRLSISDQSIQEKNVRLLKINDIIQSEMDLGNGRSVSAYVDLIDTLVPVAKGAEQALVLGLGAGLTANLLQKKDYVTDGVEFDERIIDAAKNYFFLSPEVNTKHADARYFLGRCKKKYMVILADLFKAEEQPSHVFTLESLKAIRSNLCEDGRIYITWHGYLAERTGLGTRILLNTLKNAGYYYQLHSFSNKENHRNLLIVASKKPIREDRYRLNEPIEVTDIVNTDRRPVLEKYNAAANKAWRTQYLRYYQGRN